MDKDSKNMRNNNDLDGHNPKNTPIGASVRNQLPVEKKQQPILHTTPDAIPQNHSSEQHGKLNRKIFLAVITAL